MEKNKYGMAILSGGLIWFLTGGLIFLNWAKLPPEIPFLYSLPTGQQQLITKPWLLVIWGCFGLLMWVDVILALVLARGEGLLQKFMIWGGVITQILLLMTIFKIIQIII
jgi:hypothetical protein